MNSEFEKIKTTIRRKIIDCPWGKEETLKGHTEEVIKEMKELRKALENNDINNMKEELGDVFYDTTFLLLLAEKENNLKSDDIIKNVREKIERRTPWVFGNFNKVKTREDALKFWNEIKKKERSD